MLTTENCKTIIDYVNYWAFYKGNETAFIFLDACGAPDVEVSFLQLQAKSRSVAYALQKKVKPEDRVMLLFQSGLEFIYAFLGCLYAGAIAVPIPPPQGKRQVVRVFSALKDAAAVVVLSTKAIHLQTVRLDKQEGLFASKQWMNIEDCFSNVDLHGDDLAADENALAFLQYTSGSTSVPKGVMVTHRNLICNQKIIYEAFEHAHSTKVVGWLPFYHDMGLIGNILQPLFIGVTSILMAPTTFLRNPLLWLQAISDYKGTTSGGPNFAYQFCVQRIDKNKLKRIDLSHWKIAFNGSEMVHANTLWSFIDHFAQCGFQRNAFYPCYGMAESTLFSTGIKAGAYPRIISHESSGKKLPLTSCGYCRDGHKLLIVDPITKIEAEIGEVWLQGPSIAAGYWNQPELTQNIFQAYTQSGEGPFLRTGDMGVLNDGELFLVGRLKNLLIIRGKNYYPDDIEIALQKSHPLLNGQLGAAFTINEDCEEKLVILFELDRTREKINASTHILSTIKKTLAAEFALEAMAILLVKSGHIPRTTSGKVQYYQCRERFLGNSLSIYHEWRHCASSPAQPMEGDALSRLHTYCAALLKINAQDLKNDEPLIMQGFDSLKATLFLSWLKEQFNVHIDMEEFFNDLSVKEIVELIERSEPLAIVSEGEDGELCNEIFPLSSNQADLFAAFQLNPYDVAYNIPVSLKFSGIFDYRSFENALNKVINKHPLLKAICIDLASGPHWQILNNHSIACQQCTLSSLDDTLNVIIKKEAYRPFNVLKEPLFRVTVINCGTEETLVLMTFHHLICDGWSMNLFIEDLRDLYNGKIGTSQSLEYQHHVHWQSQYKKSAHYLEDSEYWRGVLDSEFPILALGPYHKHPKIASAHGAAEHVCMDGPLFAKLKKFVKETKTTVAMSLMAAFHCLLHLYSHQNHIFIGYPSANRHPSGSQQIFGYFVNTLVSKSTFGPATSFIEILQEVKRSMIAGSKHESYPFQDLLNLLNPPRIEGVSPLFQAMFVMQNAPQKISGFLDLEVKIVPLQEFPSIYDLILEVAESDNCIKLSFEYRKNALPSFLVQQLAQHFLLLVEHGLNRPKHAIKSIPLNSKSPLVPLRHDYPASVFELIERQALFNGDKLAIASDYGSLTYQELNMRANGTAQALLDSGLRLQEPVGLCMQRSPELIAAIFGIAKAGGAYVPIDVNYPLERINHMLHDAAIRFLLIDPFTRANVSSLGVQLLDVNEINVKNEFRAIPHFKNDLAYILYTSGSTGTPKGVMVEHGALANFTMEAVKIFEIKNTDRVLQFSSICWDTSSEEIYPCLTTGGTLVLRNNEALESFDSLMQRTERYGITVWDLPTSYWQELCNALVRQQTKLPESLRLIIVGGEKVSRAVVEKWIATFGTKTKLLNTYGSTEAASISLAFDLALWPAGISDAPIGYPLGNVGAHLLNEAFEEVPMGVSGRLYLSGAGLARGYVNKPQLTAEKFVCHPKSGERFYDTGDFAYKSLEGLIFYQGRVDGLVKRRGYRIEIGEIESALNAIEYVSKCLVLEKKDETPSSSLVAYLSVEDASHLQLVRSDLSQLLPDYMIPDKFVCIKDFPRLPNGKIDLKSLAETVEQSPQKTEELNQIESQIVSIWKELLRVNFISKQMHFFDAGGNSLLIIKLHKKICDLFAINFNVSELFRYSTCAQQAQLVEALIGKSETPALFAFNLLKQLEEGTIDLETAKHYLTSMQK